MSKKVLILSGSPRKDGNSDVLCNEFMHYGVWLLYSCDGRNLRAIFWLPSYIPTFKK